MTRSFALLAACCLLLSLAGCKGQDDPTAPDPIVHVEPRTPDGLIAKFKTVYTAMDLADYRDHVLASGYGFQLQAETVVAYGLSDSVLSRADEVAVAGRMFAGEPNADGEVLSAVEIQQMQPQGAWLPVESDDSLFGGVAGAKVRTYSVLLYFDLGGDARYEVSGLQLFYVVPDTIVVDGVRVPDYRLLGQLDLTGTGPKGVDSLSWSDVKALWM